jgi:hypothetical protein
LFAAILPLAGCGLADAISELKSLTELGIDDGASAGESISALATPAAGATLELETGATLSVPAGALEKELELSMKRPEDKEALALIKSVSKSDKVASAPYVLTPHGAQFKKSVEITLPLGKGRDQSKIAVAWLEDEQDTSWELLGTPKIVGDKAKIALDHFSVLVLLELGANDWATDGPSAGSGGGSVVEPVPDESPAQDAGAPSVVVPDVSPDAGVDECASFDCGTPTASCDSSFRCETTLSECGIDVDNCGAAHDVVQECGRPGCGELGQCTESAQGNACGACTPYASCTEALASVQMACHPAVPDGCGGFMDCSATCADSPLAGYATACTWSESNARYSCQIPCADDTECPPEVSYCVDASTLEIEFWSCQPEGSCSGMAARTTCSCVDGTCP